jgi:murein DD-endopeptidase MepM/ murein hydrolase activator NlpD
MIYKILLIGLLLYCVIGCNSPTETKEEIVLQEDSIVIRNLKFGFDLDSFIVYQGEINNNQYLADILLKHKVTYPEITQVAENAKSVFDVRKIHWGRPYTILCAKDSVEKAQYFIYQPNLIDYVVYELCDSMRVYFGKKEVTKREKQIATDIQSSLYVALEKTGTSPELALKLASIYAWTIDFYRIQKGDEIRVHFEELFVEDEYAGIGNIIASRVDHGGKEQYAFTFVQDSVPDYFDEEGNSLRKAFLKMPLKYGRLTSGFSNKRFHPVQKRFKAHLGTDYAAPKGTPILAVGDGVVIESAHGKYNGNYVKIRHNSTYTTQYLHMSARKVKKGEYVRQGQIIGLVGSTGLATGPHVCFRFWKNGNQVDHRREEFPPSEPIKEEQRARFTAFTDSLKKIVDIPIALEQAAVNK